MFIVGGVGITPTRSILRTLRDTGDRRLAWLVYGAGSSATVLRRSELEALARDQVLDLTLATQEPPPGWEGERGLINREMLARSLPDPATAGLQYFICGPGPMLDAVAEALQRLRVPGRAIRAERFNIARGVGRGGTRPFSAAVIMPCHTRSSMKEDRMRPIAEVAAAMGLGWDRLEPYGRDKAKVPLDAFPEVAQPARVVVVTAITPTSAGEGKTTVALGLTDGLNQTGRRTVATIRQPSLGPLFGRKGGGTGGGRATAEPGAEINLHFTGDFHAIQSAHNFLAAMTDHAVRQGMVPEFTPSRMTWRRVTDAQDRALRHTVIGLGGSTNGPLRETGYDSSAASEIMAIIALAHDYDDLRARLASIVVGWNRAGRPVTAGDVRAVGSMMVLLKDALKPNVVQTQEGYPVVVHAGPFGNIAHGCSSIVADRLAQACADYVVTEAGFGVDLGFTKFMDIKVRQGGPEPDAAVVVATVRGLKWHGGTASAELGHADVAAVERGIANLRHAIEVVRRYGLPAVVAINRFPQDHPDEVAAVQRAAIEAGALAAVEAHGFADGGRGMRALADAVVQAVDTGDACVQLLYRDEDPLAAKVAATAERVFLAGEVQWTPQARATARRFEAQGWDFPVCIAKTHLSISADPRLRGAPAGHVFPVRELRVAAGARQVICLAGDIVTLPGLPPTPNAFGIDLAPDGTVVGLL